MDSSILLSKIVGPLFIVLALSLVINASLYKSFLNNAWKDQFILFFAWFISFIIGMLMVLYHNKWEWNWFVIITILWYLAVIKWISLILFPNSTLNITKKMKISKGLIKLIWLVYLMVWFYLTYLWYFS